MPRNLTGFHRSDALFKARPSRNSRKILGDRSNDALRPILEQSEKYAAKCGCGLPDFQVNTFSNCRAKIGGRCGAPNLRSVINAYCIIIHTKFGPFPLGPSAVRAISDVAVLQSKLDSISKTANAGSAPVFAPLEILTFQVRAAHNDHTLLAPRPLLQAYGAGVCGFVVN